MSPRRLLLLLLFPGVFFYSCATGAPPAQDGTSRAGAGEGAVVEAEALDPAWQGNLLRTRHYSFGLPPDWTAEILDEDAEWLLISLLGGSGASGTLEFFSGALGQGEETVKRFLRTSVAGADAEISELTVEQVVDAGRRDITYWFIEESEGEGRYVLYGGLSGILGGPSAAWLLQGRTDLDGWNLAPWPATTVASLNYDYRIGDVRIREGTLSFYGGEQWRWLADTPEGIVAQQLGSEPGIAIILGAPHPRVASRFANQGLSFDQPEYELETLIREESALVPFVTIQADGGPHLHGRLEEGLHVSVIPGEPVWEPETLLAETAAFLEAHLFLPAKEEGGQP
ncbi:MAG: hypothetical protein ACLFNP_12250 [Spirochaetaceae bacterium]